MKYYKVRYGWNTSECASAMEHEKIIEAAEDVLDRSLEENMAYALKTIDPIPDWLEIIEELNKYILEYNDIDDKWKIKTFPIYAKSLEDAWDQVDLICFHLEEDGLLERDSEVFVRES
jgi:hypothetical protein